MRGDHIPQHRLLTKAEWNYLLFNGRIKKFTYWTTFGPYHRPETKTINYPYAESVTIYRKDYLMENAR